MVFETNPNGEQVAVIFTPYITKKGKRIYHPHGGVFRIEIPMDKYRNH
ncbi:MULTISPECIES: hypothetical protein [Haemophilus]|jgi:hypothetical protein|nr:MULTISPECIES: hypothetical protein [Haemophilus]MBS6188909.1 hypothetical protein [Haemophilus parainfluenzae]MDN3211834.1 hypothetical protein [Haemophilus sp. SZY H51]MDU4896010.1 hypothetical protein [Haemophilus parainfluenzae]MDU6707825.1 hypothetical protein [Haemophilus parainfluenzae]